MRLHPTAVSDTLPPQAMPYSLRLVPTEYSAAWAPGECVGSYRLVGRIGTGGMAEIWLARQSGPQRFEKAVVIKKIADSIAEDAQFVQMFLDEARIAAQLNHPNIVQIYDLG